MVEDSGKKNTGTAGLIPFDAFFSRLSRATGISTQMALAEALGVHRSAVTQAKLRNAVPPKWVLALARKFSVAPDWLEFGKGAMQGHMAHSGQSAGRAALLSSAGRPPLSAEGFVSEMVAVPKMAATLSAGGGSYEVGAYAVETHAFPRQWLSRMGNPEQMVFLDVVGSSMEPSICDGDMVLVDRAGTRANPHGIFAVGFEDTLYIKRVEPRNGAVILHSDNPDYSDIEISGDELESFRILGKVIWLCRDFRL
jgi:Predicted transcriptional regulator